MKAARMLIIICGILFTRRKVWGVLVIYVVGDKGVVNFRDNFI